MQLRTKQIPLGDKGGWQLQYGIVDTIRVYCGHRWLRFWMRNVTVITGTSSILRKGQHDDS